jgi:hypothetical protein
MTGAIAGAVGTIALDVASYTDMAVRARSSSGLPAEVVKRLSKRAGVPIENDNRASALGAISGYAVGVGVGAAYGALRSRFRHSPLMLSALGLAIAAMAAADVPATRVGATDPKAWGITGWISDIIPHAAYGLATAVVFDALNGRADNVPDVSELQTTIKEVRGMVVEIDDLGD